MENKFGYVTRVLFRLYIYLKDKFDIKPRPSEEERHIFSICTKLIKMPTTSLLFGPISRKRYIYNEPEGIFCIVNMGTITLISQGSYFIVFPENPNKVREITDLFDKETETRRETLEISQKGKVINTLSSINQRLIST